MNGNYGKPKKEFEETLQYTPVHHEWADIPENEYSYIHLPLAQQQKKILELFNKSCILYFPPNRFEEPAWLNVENLNSRAVYSELKHITRQTNRRIINYSPLRLNQNWLLDLLFDSRVLETQIRELPVEAVEGQHARQKIQVAVQTSTESENLVGAVLNILRTIVHQEGNLQLGIGRRKNRYISLQLNDKPFIQNVFQLSTGETSLLNLFLTILRDYDLCQSPFVSLDQIRGTVIIDEIDLHLHTIYQRDVLPQLIKMFPRVQFILTTHSPLFIMGLERSLGKDGYSLFELPGGAQVGVEQFSEFDAAFSAYKDTVRYSAEIEKHIAVSRKPILFVEGDYDIRYLRKASGLLNKNNVLDQIEIRDGGGFRNLDKRWNAFDVTLANKIILLYDCDTNKQEETKGNIYRKVIPTNKESPVKKGIENLFSKVTLQKAMAAKPAFIDITAAHERRKRGVEIKEPESWEVNPDEKANLCEWLCEHGEVDDFGNLAIVFEIIEGVLQTPYATLTKSDEGQ